MSNSGNSAKTVKVGRVEIGRGSPLALIAGPCVIESEEVAMKTADKVAELASKYKIGYIFKSSYLKDNRSSVDKYSGPGLEKGLKILEKVKRTLQVPVLTDVHSAAEASLAGEVVDVIQIPAFLCKQTDILLAAGKTGRAVNIKKGQFVAPEDIVTSVKKVESTGNYNILLTERGSSFGYHNLVVDMRSLLIMSRTGCPVIFDATHSVQMPAAVQGASSGQPEFTLPLARAAVACGCDGLFVETHPDVKNALCDANCMLPLQALDDFLRQVTGIYQLINSQSKFEPQIK